MTTQPDPEIAGTERLRVELERQTGLRLSRSAVDRKVRTGRIPYRKLPGANGPYLFRAEDVPALADEFRAEKLVNPAVAS